MIDSVVMVVEDHGFQRRMAVRLLAELGVREVLEAADGHAALQQLADRDTPPDVLLVDLDLPGMDGIEFIGHVAERALARSVAVVSALDPALLNTVQGMARAYGLRVIGAVEKPITTSKLQQLFERMELLEQDLGDGNGIEVERDELETALDEGRIQPWFQPQVTFSNGQLVAVEALARWTRADGSLVYPAQFVAVAEREGLIDRLTECLLQQACEWRRRWSRQGLLMRVTVNMSMRNLRRLDAADRYLAILRQNAIDPRDMVLELTESSIMEEAASALHVLARLRLKGFGLSIDDFGTGYSSLAQLAQIPFTELKIDRSFVAGAPRNPRKRAVVEASLDLARKLSLGVVAEGVETVDEWQMLAELGCTYAQGHLIARAVPGEQVAEAVARWRRPDV